MREKFSDLISGIGLQQHKNESLLSEDMMKYAPQIEKI
jgi:hypothetical protein